MRLLIFFFVAGIAAPALAQDHQHEQHQVGTESPYTDLTERTIKALSADDVASLRAGEGMGLALSAELNGFPGPRHVLDMSEQLALTETQIGSTQELFASMNAQAREMGERLIKLETQLDEAFSDRTITSESLQSLTGEIGQLKAALRASHLSAHLRMMDILDQGQIHSYNMLRGYHGEH